MEKKCAIAVSGVLIVIVIVAWRGCSKRALERTLENMGIAEVKQLNGEVGALVKGIEDEHAAENKWMADMEAAEKAAQERAAMERAEVKRIMAAERAAQEKAEREMAAARGIRRSIINEMEHKIAAWNRGLESDLAVLNGAIEEIRKEENAKYDAMSEEQRTKITGHPFGYIEERVEERIVNSLITKDYKPRYTLARFYKIFGRPDYWRPTELGVYFYYDRKHGKERYVIRLELCDGYRNVSFSTFSPEVFEYIRVNLVRQYYADSIPRQNLPTNLRLANEDSFQPLKDKDSLAISKLIADWRARAIEEPSRVSIKDFYDVFGEPVYLGKDGNNYYFYYNCKKQMRVDAGDPDSPFRKETKIVDVIAKFNLRRDFNIGRVYIEDVSYYRPSDLANYIKDLELKAKRRKSGQVTGVDQKTAD